MPRSGQGSARSSQSPWASARAGLAVACFCSTPRSAAVTPEPPGGAAGPAGLYPLRLRSAARAPERLPAKRAPAASASARSRWPRPLPPGARRWAAGPWGRPRWAAAARRATRGRGRRPPARPKRRWCGALRWRCASSTPCWATSPSVSRAPPEAADPRGGGEGRGRGRGLPRPPAAATAQPLRRPPPTPAAHHPATDRRPTYTAHPPLLTPLHRTHSCPDLCSRP